MEIFLHTPSLIIGSIGTQLLFLATLGALRLFGVGPHPRPVQTPPSAPAGELEAVRG